MKFLTYVLASATALKLQGNTDPSVAEIIKSGPSEDNFNKIHDPSAEEFYAAACTAGADTEMKAALGAWYHWLMGRCKDVDDGEKGPCNVSRVYFMAMQGENNICVRRARAAAANQ